MATKKQSAPEDNGAEATEAETPAATQTIGVPDLPPTGVSSDQHQFTLYGEEGAWFWRCTCGKTGNPVAEENRPYELWIAHQQRATAGDGDEGDE